MMVYALVDYDNAKVVDKERSILDVRHNVSRIAIRCAQIANANYNQCTDVCIRFYGGWTDVMSNPTTIAGWMYAAIGDIRRRVLGLRFHPAVATNNIYSEFPNLVGLHRGGAQKMVDTLIVADIAWISARLDGPIVLLSDDEDMLPGTVVAVRMSRPIVLCRRRAMGEALNDRMLSNMNIVIEGEVT